MVKNNFWHISDGVQNLKLYKIIIVDTNIFYDFEFIRANVPNVDLINYNTCVIVILFAVNENKSIYLNKHLGILFY